MTLETPIRVHVSTEAYGSHRNSVAFDGITMNFEYPMDLSLPDILYDSTTGTLTGLLFNVAGDSANAKRLCARLSKQFVRFHDKNSAFLNELGIKLNDEVMLEISWLDAVRPAEVTAQLANVGFWFTPDYNYITAIELWDIRHHLTGFDYLTGREITMPNLADFFPSLILNA